LIATSASFSIDILPEHGNRRTPAEHIVSPEGRNDAGWQLDADETNRLRDR
jgi:hypothetical protein